MSIEIGLCWHLIMEIKSGKDPISVVCQPCSMHGRGDQLVEFPCPHLATCTVKGTLDGVLLLWFSHYQMQSLRTVWNQITSSCHVFSERNIGWCYGSHITKYSPLDLSETRSGLDVPDSLQGQSGNWLGHGGEKKLWLGNRNHPNTWIFS